MRIPILFFCFLILHITYAQNKCRVANKKLKKIEKHIVSGESKRASELLLDIESICQDPVFLTSIGDVYFSLKNMRKAHSFYLKSYELNSLNDIRVLSLSNFLKSSYAIGNYGVFNQIIHDPSFNIDVNKNIKVKDLI